MKSILFAILAIGLYSGELWANCTSNSHCGYTEYCDYQTGRFGRTTRVGECREDIFGSGRGGGMFGRNECSSNLGCKTNEICIQGSCREQKSGVECSWDPDCGYNEVCDSGWMGKNVCRARTDEETRREEENYSKKPRKVWKIKLPASKSKKKKMKGPRHKAYNACMKKNRKIKPVSQRIAKCAHLRK